MLFKGIPGFIATFLQPMVFTESPKDFDGIKMRTIDWKEKDQ